MCIRDLITGKVLGGIQDSLPSTYARSPLEDTTVYGSSHPETIVCGWLTKPNSSAIEMVASKNRFELGGIRWNYAFPKALLDADR